MIIEITREIPNTAFSVFRYLKDVMYKADGVVGRLVDHHSGLAFTDAYPDDLSKVLGPVLAIHSLNTVVEDTPFFGAYDSEKTIHLPIYGFVVGKGSATSMRGNVLYRDRLSNDLVNLFKHANGDGVFVLYEQASKQAIGHLEVIRATARTIVVPAPAIEADRFKFLVDLSLAYSTEIQDITDS